MLSGIAADASDSEIWWNEKILAVKMPMKGEWEYFGIQPPHS